MDYIDKTKVYTIILGQLEGCPSDCLFSTMVRAANHEAAVDLALLELRDELVSQDHDEDDDADPDEETASDSEHEYPPPYDNPDALGTYLAGGEGAYWHSKEMEGVLRQFVSAVAGNDRADVSPCLANAKAVLGKIDRIGRE